MQSSYLLTFMRICLVLALTLSVLVGCGPDSKNGPSDGPDEGMGGGGSANTGGSGAGTDSGGVVQLLYGEPGDLTTDHDSDTTRIAITSYGYGSSPPLVQHLSLRTYPADVLVPVTIDLEQLDSGSPGSAWVLHPDSSLEAGWYAVVLAPESKLGLSQGHQRADGGFENRFRVGSQPLLTGVGACASDDLSLLPKLRLDFSELVTLPAGDPPIDVVVDGTTPSCVVYDPSSPGNPGMGLTCTPPIPASAASITVTVGTGIVSASSGLALESSAGSFPQTYELPAGTQYDSCRYWHETVVPAN